MKINKKYGVRVPATTANIGSGFDTLGMALGLYNEAYFTPVNELSLMKSHIDIQGEGAGKIKPGADNMVLQAMQAVAGKVGKEIPGGELSLLIKFLWHEEWEAVLQHLFPARILPTNCAETY